MSFEQMFITHSDKGEKSVQQRSSWGTEAKPAAHSNYIYQLKPKYMYKVQPQLEIHTQQTLRYWFIICQ